MLQGCQGVVQAQVMLQQVQQGLTGPGKGCLDVLHVAAAAAAVLCNDMSNLVSGLLTICDMCEQQGDKCGQQDAVEARLADVMTRDVQLDEKTVCGSTEVLRDSSCCLLCVSHISAGFL